jgi:glycosyltransferase involved in cell wall biosynthesis
MAVRRYGIYLLYPPGLSLETQGLGRLMAAFLRGANESQDIRFVIVCPSWMRQPLHELLTAERVQFEGLEICAPSETPMLLAIHDRKKRMRLRGSSASEWSGKRGRISHSFRRYARQALRRAAYTTTGFGAIKLIPQVTLLTGLLVLGGPPLLARAAINRLRLWKKRWWRRGRRSPSRKVATSAPVRGKHLVVARAYEFMTEAEAERMQTIIEGMPDIVAWYSPTAFWPSFNRIAAPRVMCVPDLLMAEFPVGFAAMGEALETNFSQLTAAVRGGAHFITYSETVKSGTLGGRMGVGADRVTVIPHAPQDMSRWLDGAPGLLTYPAIDRHSQALLASALRRSPSSYLAGFANPQVKFVFYASQFRPNKNVITLLRAYRHLLRDKFVAHKLILTGRPAEQPSIEEFIAEHRLGFDVLFVPGLSVQELAAFYRLADLAVNPSLSEGGFPFTFTEALSVDTPVVMSKIPVTLEIVTDPSLQDMMLFDPYDWRDVAGRMQWALENPRALLEQQKPLYDKLASRTWRDVVREHIAVFDKISGTEAVERPV